MCQMEHLWYLLGMALSVLLLATVRGGATLGKLLASLRANVTSLFILYAATQQLQVARRNSSEGAEVTVSMNGSVVYNISLSTLHLPSDCGEKNVYCRNILVTSSGPLSRRIFIPLSNAFCIVEATSNGTMSFAHHVVPVNRPCSPVTFFKLLNSVYAVCLNLRTDYLNVLSVHPDTLQVQDVIDPPPQDLQIPLQVSNFVVPNTMQSSLPADQVLYFTSGSDLHRIAPLTTTSDIIGTLPDCNIAYTLTSSEDGSTLLASCHDTTVYFDLQEWRLLNITTTAIDGYQYICQSANIRVVAIPATKQGVQLNVTRWDSGGTSSLYLNTTLPYLGLCFGYGSQASFAYANVTGVFLTNLTSAKTIALHMSQCTDNQQYDRHEIFFEKYLLMHQKCDAGGSISLIINTISMSVQITSDDVVVLFQFLVPVPNPTPLAPSSSNTTQYYLTSTAMTPNEQIQVAIILGLGISVPLGSGLIAALAVICCIIW